jgi:hypothetical protein
MKSTFISRLRKIITIKSLINQTIELIGFLYRLFIFVQMCCLGYGESLRIKKYVNYILNNSRKIKINQLNKNN